MDKNAIKKYATWARTELITRVTQRAEKYGISADADPNADTVRDIVLTATEKKQRAALIKKVKEEGFDQVMEEVAYTWFNRFSALRFMEVNNYLPSRVRVFTDDNNEFKPQILTEAIHMELEGLDMEKVYALKESNNDEELYKYLLITQCNALSSVLPRMFQRIADYTELLFPDNLLRDGSVIQQMIELIPEDDWKDQVQIIGWLYQYYNTEPKDRVFADLKKNIKITKEKIPAATQLFTPDWIVRYMVENSLGRLWLEGHPANKNQFLPSKEEQDHYIKTHEEDGKWHYYLEEAEQEPDVEAQLKKIRDEHAKLRPEDIRSIDPCCGSGHIICRLFDVFIQIYQDYGIQTRDAVRSIVQNNLWGLDIDERAAQLAYFSVMMKAVQYDPRFLRRKDASGIPDIPQPNVYAIRESNYIDKDAVIYYTNADEKLKNALNGIIRDLYDAKEYGSLISVSKQNWSLLYDRFDEIKKEGEISLYTYAALEMEPLVRVAETLAQEYHVVVTNPPYMGSKQGMNDILKKYLKNHYSKSKSDLYAAFMDASYRLTCQNGYFSMINQHGWMFLSSFSELRKFLVTNTSIINMLHLGTRAFEEIGGEVVQTTSFTMQKINLNYKGKYFRLSEISDAKEKEQDVIDYVKNGISSNIYEFPMNYYSYLPDNLIGYWISIKLIDIFNREKPLSEIAKPRQGLSTSDNARFLRLWFEPNIHNIGFGFRSREEAAHSKLKWFPYNKGGEYRKWYGNNNYVINWQYDGKELREWADYLNTHGTSMGRLVSQEFYFKKGLTWSGVGATRFGVRCYDYGMLFDVGANGLFVKENLYYYLAGFLNTVLANEMIKVLNPTINTGSGTVGKLPIIIDNSKVDEVTNIVKENIQLVKNDWDEHENSWDFSILPLMKNSKETLIENAYINWKECCEERFNKLRNNEQKLNEIFLQIYGLESELNSEVNEEDVSIRLITKKQAIIEFISIAVGCMFGRYSLNDDGLVFAGGKFDITQYHNFTPDLDNIIPICDDEYFNDDIVGRFIKFVEAVYGKQNLEENIKFIAKALGGKGQPLDTIRNYFLNDFFKDHCDAYSVTGSGKRPIYWLFDSGKKNGFKCLVYMHRYQPDTIARIRTDYVHEQQARYRTAISGLERQLEDAPTSERVHLNNQLKKLKDQAEETRKYEEKIHHLADQMISINLDDGVKHNYAIFQDVLAKIK
ncbi:BREX-1 system adenine-specific DNA-methyltransferase PglX [Bacillota bacterium LCP21S3_F9]